MGARVLVGPRSLMVDAAILVAMYHCARGREYTTVGINFIFLAVLRHSSIVQGLLVQLA